MSKLTPLKIDHNESFDIVEIEGIRYSGDLFREWGTKGMPLGTPFRIVKREDGALHVQKIENTRIRIGPVELACKKCGAKDVFTMDVENPNTQKLEEVPNGETKH